MVVSLTGLLLGWKKNTGGYILPSSAKGSSLQAEEWLSIAELQQRATAVLINEVDNQLSSEIDRIDVRPDKGMVKFTFKGHYQEIQLDCATGEVLNIGLRRSDFLEQLHDGSLVDRYLGTKFFKLFYTTVMALALLTFTITGFWLWLGPRRMRQH